MSAPPPEPSAATAARAPLTPWQWWRGPGGWARTARISTYLATGLVLVLVIAAVVGVVFVRRPLPQVDGSTTVPGLEGRVEVIRDGHGIAQIYADSTADLMRAEGYVHAQERFYEMDVRRHATAGRLAELFGAQALESDQLVRTMGWRRVAEQEVALIRPETRAAFEAYAEGVNAYLAGRGTTQISLAYTVLAASGLDYRPEPWTVADSLAWLKAMAWDLRGNMGEELDRALATEQVGAARAEQLWPDYAETAHTPIVAQGRVVDDVFEPDAVRGGTRLPQRPAYDALARTRAGLDALPSWLGSGDGIGSNSWVVDGAHSSTGEPLLANDPHLGVGLPGVWMQVGLHCRSVSAACPYDVAGFSFSGVPGVIIGHNADIAWGFTNLGPDVTDLYLEQVRGDTVRRGDSWVPLSTRTETFAVRGEADVELTVRATDHGPVISDTGEQWAELADAVRSRAAESGDDDGGAGGDDYAVALQWTALTPGVTADAILDLDQAGDFGVVRSAASSFEAPAQNLVYADTDGHIGYQAPGRIPIRRSGNDGRLPSAGWLAANDWTGQEVPFDALPWLLDPDEGFVVTANQQVIDPGDYPYFLTGDWDRGYRSERIRERIEAALGNGQTLSPEAMAQIQLDDENPMAAVLTPYLLAADLPGGYYSEGQRVLADWDLGQGADSAGAAYYNVVWRNLLELTFHDELSEQLWPDGGQRWFAVLTVLLQRPDDAWWDDVGTDDVVETRDVVVRQAMLDARDEIRRLQSRPASGWSWGGLHRLELREPTLGDSGIGPVEALFDRGGWELAGGSSTVDATAWDAAVGYQVTAAPSMRMVVSLGDLEASRWINLTGVAGHPFSVHYTDQTDLWARGETLAWPFSRAAVEATAEDTLILQPGPDS